MYQRLYPKLPTGNLARFEATYQMEGAVVDSFMSTVNAGLPTLAAMTEDDAMQYLEWTFRIFMQGWGNALEWSKTLI